MRQSLLSYLKTTWCGGSCARNFLPSDSEVLTGVVDIEDNGSLTFRVRDADLIALTQAESDETQELLAEELELTRGTITAQTAVIQSEFDQTQTELNTINTSIGVTNTRLTTINNSIAATNTLLTEVRDLLEVGSSTVTLLSVAAGTPVTVSPGYRALSFTAPAGSVTTVNGAQIEGRFELPLTSQHEYETAIVIESDSTTPITVTEIR